MRGVFSLLAVLVGCELPQDDGVGALPSETGDTGGTPTVPVALCDQPGTICTVAGASGVWGYNGDGPALDAWFYLPTSVLALPDGSVEFADWNNHRIRTLRPDGFVETLAGNGAHSNAVAGSALVSPFENPIDTTHCPDDSGFYVAELHAHRIDYVSGDGQLSYVAGLGGEPGYDGDGGPANQAHLFEPTGVACGPDGTLYFSDSVNNVIRSVSPAGIIDTLAGTGEMGYRDGPGDQAQFFKPQHLIVRDGAVYVADWLNSAIRRIALDDQTVSTVVGTGVAGFAGDGGTATQAQLRYPYGFDFGADGSIYIADTDNHVIRRVDSKGIISTIVGLPPGPETDPITGALVAHPGQSGDGGPASAAQLNWPNDVTVAPDAKLWIADTMNSVLRTVKLEEAD